MSCLCEEVQCSNEILEFRILGINTLQKMRINVVLVVKLCDFSLLIYLIVSILIPAPACELCEEVKFLLSSFWFW